MTRATVPGHATANSLPRGGLVGNTLLTGGVSGVKGSLVVLLPIAAIAAFWLRRAFASRA